MNKHERAACEAAEYSDAVKAAVSFSPGTYVEQARAALLAALGDAESDWDSDRELLDLYTLLVLTVGTRCTNEHIHDAWAVARQRTRPDHPDIVRYSQLDPEVQSYDTRFRVAVQRAATTLNGRNAGAP